MGKASKWIKNFLIGKKEEYNKKKAPLVTFAGTSTAIVSSTPRVRRRWSFGRSKNKEIFQHKFCKSLDAMDASILPVQLMIELARMRNISPWGFSTETCYDFRDKAAIKIQAVFRSFLARKALCALRGLVKIQALVRGHLVRKRTSATLRCMHALMTIQVRARVQRIQMSEGEQSQRRSTFNSSRLRYEHGGEEKSLAKHGSLRYCPRKPITSPEEEIGDSIIFQAVYANRIGDEHQPSYMGNTKSSKAKERPQSEPKQRPISVLRQKGRKSISIKGTNVDVLTGKVTENQNGLGKDSGHWTSTKSCSH